MSPVRETCVPPHSSAETRSPRSASVDQKLTIDEARSSERYWGVVMPLVDENRILVRQGMEVLRRGERKSREEILRRLGMKSIRELVGRTDTLIHLDYYNLPVDDDLRRGA